MELVVLVAFANLFVWEEDRRVRGVEMRMLRLLEHEAPHLDLDAGPQQLAGRDPGLTRHLDAGDHHLIALEVAERVRQLAVLEAVLGQARSRLVGLHPQRNDHRVADVVLGIAQVPGGEVAEFVASLLLETGDDPVQRVELDAAGRGCQLRLANLAVLAPLDDLSRLVPVECFATSQEQSFFRADDIGPGDDVRLVEAYHVVAHEVVGVEGPYELAERVEQVDLGLLAVEANVHVAFALVDAFDVRRGTVLQHDLSRPDGCRGMPVDVLGQDGHDEDHGVFFRHGHPFRPLCFGALDVVGQQAQRCDGVCLWGSPGDRIDAPD